MVQTYNQPQPLANFRLGEVRKPNRSDLQKMSEFELILELNTSGWTYAHQKVSKKTPPYTKDGQKIWFYHTSSMTGGINYRYLSVLVLSADLFADGLKEIFHGQPVSYYDALLKVSSSALNKILPWQTKSFYSDLIRKQGQYDTRKRKRRLIPQVANDDCDAYCGVNTETPGISHTNAVGPDESNMQPPVGNLSSSSDSSIDSDHEPEPEDECDIAKDTNVGTGYDQEPLATVDSFQKAPSSSSTSTGPTMDSKRGEDELADSFVEPSSSSTRTGPKKDSNLDEEQLVVSSLSKLPDKCQSKHPKKRRDSKTTEVAATSAIVPLQLQPAVTTTSMESTAKKPVDQKGPPAERVKRLAPARALRETSRIGGGSASVFNPSTVWIGDVPIIPRTDQKARSFYVKCPLHGTHMRSCSRQMSKGTEDIIIRSLMYWLLQGSTYVECLHCE